MIEMDRFFVYSLVSIFFSLNNVFDSFETLVDIVGVFILFQWWWWWSSSFLFWFGCVDLCLFVCIKNDFFFAFHAQLAMFIDDLSYYGDGKYFSMLKEYSYVVFLIIIISVIIPMMNWCFFLMMMIVCVCDDNRCVCVTNNSFFFEQQFFSLVIVW